MTTLWTLRALLAALLLATSAAHAAATASTSQEQEALDSMAKAAPLHDKINAGGSVSDQEVKDARIGMMEPFMLVKAAYRRQTDAIEVTYAQDIAALQPQTMLTPASLVSADSRSRTRARLTTWHQIIGTYNTQMAAANARARREMKALEPQLPPFAYGPTASGFERALGLIDDFVASLVAGETAAVAGIAALLDFMDSIPGGYHVEQGPPVKLLFRDQATLDRYLALFGKVHSASQEASKAKARLSQALADRNARPGAVARP